MNRLPRDLSAAEEVRVFAGLVVQPFVAAGLASVLYPLLPGHRRVGEYSSYSTDAALSVASGIFIVAVVVTGFGVLPASVGLIKRQRLTLGATLLFGLIFGNLPYVLMALVAGGTYGLPGLLRGLAFSSLLGLSGAALFWIITVRPLNLRHHTVAG